MYKIKTIFQTLFLVGFLVSCQNYESVPDFDESLRYDGTIWNYLQAGDATLNLHFDSLTHVIGANDDIRTLLSDENAQLTFFAIPNECFKSVLKTLNTYREKKKLGASLNLDSLLTKEVIIIHDTIINRLDTTFMDRVYNYPEEMKELTCRYILDKVYDTDAIEVDGGEFLTESYGYKYNMGLTVSRHPASGCVGNGVKFMLFSDANNSQLKSKWVQSNVTCFDIYAKNGVIHVLSTSHEFGFDEFVTRFNNFGNEYEKTE